MVSNGSVEENCIFHEAGMCIMHQGYHTKCSLCFNFASVSNPGEKGKVKPMYNLFDYLKAKGGSNVLFPSDDSVQTTL